MKSFIFEETFRADMADLESGVRLHPKRNRLEITPNEDGTFPTDPDLFARTRLTTPEACRGWKGFFAVSNNPKGPGNVVLTDIRFKLSDGATDYYWNSGANDWTPAALNNWNTEQEVADNIDKWPRQAMQVVVNLSTTDKNETPSVDEIRLAYDTDMVFLEDYVVRSLMDEMKSLVRPISRVSFKTTAAGQTVFSLGDIQTPYEIVDIDAVYNDTQDPIRFNPIDHVYDAVANTVTTTSGQGNNEVVTVMFSWQPVVTIRRSQDFSEIGKIPAIVISDQGIENRREIRARPYLINKSTGAGWVFENGYQADIRLSILFITGLLRDQHVMEQEIARFFENHSTLFVRGQDERYQVEVTRDFDDASVATKKELNTGRLTVLVRNAVFYPEDAKEITGVTSFAITGGNVAADVTP